MKRSIIILTLLVLLFQACNQAQTDAKPPNIVYILADDLGWGDVRCNNPDSKIPTPNIDMLATQGMRFTDGHSPAQICTPTRYSILTGRYYWRNEVYKEIGWRVVQPWLKPLLEENRLTLPKMLKEKGYETACIGKWHLGFDWEVIEGGVRRENYKDLDYTKKVGGGPTTRGFDYFFGFDTPNSSYVFIENDAFTEIPSQKPYHPYAEARADKTAKGWTFEKILPTLAEKALGYIEQKAQTDISFFLYFPLNGPHTPIAPDKPFIGKSGAGAYGDFVYQIDWVVGQIIKKLKDLGIYDNTIIVFSSDNGSPERDGTNYVGELKSVIERYGHRPNAPYLGMKADLWEGGHRVPFIIRWPGVTVPRSVSGVTVSQLDIMATLAGYLNFDLPENAAEDSYDIMPALKGKDIVGHDPLILFNGIIPTIRSGKWKLILHSGATGFSRHAGHKTPDDAPEGQLYNMDIDSFETTNLWLKHPEIVEKLKKELQQHSE